MSSMTLAKRAPSSIASSSNMARLLAQSVENTAALPSGSNAAVGVSVPAISKPRACRSLPSAAQAGDKRNSTTVVAMTS
jgi:hypothetical protein